MPNDYRAEGGWSDDDFPDLQIQMQQLDTAGLAEPLTLPTAAPSDPVSLRLVHEWVSTLPRAILSDMRDSGDFHALFSMMVGLGLSQQRLAEHLQVTAATVSRYCNAESTPQRAAERSGILLETYRLVRRELANGSLGVCLAYAKAA